MKFHYDKKIDALSLRFNNRKYFESDEVADGVIFDLDKAGKIIAIELLDASKRFSPDFKNQLKKKSVDIVLA